MMLEYEGSVKRFLEALKTVRASMPQGGTLGGDELNRRRMQKAFRLAEIASKRDALYGGDIA